MLGSWGSAPVSHQLRGVRRRSWEQAGSRLVQLVRATSALVWKTVMEEDAGLHTQYDQVVTGLLSIESLRSRLFLLCAAKGANIHTHRCKHI